MSNWQEHDDWCWVACPHGHYEISPREREDDQRRLEREFSVQELADEDERDKAFRRGGDGEPE